MAPAAEGPEGAYLRGRVLDAIAEALRSLPPEQREVFVAHEFEGRSFKTLAADSGTPVNTLLGRKHAAVTFLRERLAQCTGGKAAELMGRAASAQIWLMILALSAS